MTSKYILVILLFLLIIPICLAQDADDPIEIGPYKQNSKIDIRIVCTENGADCASDAECNITVDYPNTTSMIQNTNMSKNNTLFNYTLPDSSILGKHTAMIKCLSSNYNTTKNYYFYVTETGDKSSTLFISLIQLAVKIVFFLFLIYIAILGIRYVRDANKNKKTPYVMIAFLRVIWGSLSYAVIFMSPLLALFLFHPNFPIGIVQNLTLNTYYIIIIIMSVIILLNIFWFSSQILLKFGGLSHDAERTNKVLNDLSRFSDDFQSIKNKTMNKLFKR